MFYYLKFDAKIMNISNITRKNMEKTDKIKQRVLQFAKSQHLIMGDFYKKISVHPSTFSGKGLQSSLSGDIIAEILTIYPELSADWLLLEKGEMLRKNNGKNLNVSDSPQATVSNGDMAIQAPVELLNLLTSQQETIRIQADIISNLTKPI